MTRSLRLAAPKDSRSTRSAVCDCENASSRRTGATAKGPCRRGSAKKSGTVQAAAAPIATADIPGVGTLASTRSGGASEKSARTASRPRVRNPSQAIPAK